MYQRCATKSYVQDMILSAASADVTMNSTTIKEASLLHPGRLLCAISEKKRSNSAS